MAESPAVNNDVENDEDDISHMTVGELISHLQKFDPNENAIILAQVPYDKDDPDNEGKSVEDLEDESTLELPILGIDHIEYDDEHAVKSVGLICDMREILDGDDSEDEELIDDGED